MGERSPRVLIIGGGELGSATAHRLFEAGMMVFVADLERPTCIRTGVCFAAALREGAACVEGVTAVAVESGHDQAEEARGAGRTNEDRTLAERALAIVRDGKIPVLAVGTGEGESGLRRLAAGLGVDVVVDARMLRGGRSLAKGMAPLTVGLGPGFTAGVDVDVVIETNRGEGLGKVIRTGSAEPATGVPAPVEGYTHERVIRSPQAGTFKRAARVGDLVLAGSIIGTVTPAGDGGAGGAAGGTGAGAPATPAQVTAPIVGLLRGLVMDGTAVRAKQKIGDVDPRGSGIDPLAISDKGHAVAGGVLEAVRDWIRSHA